MSFLQAQQHLQSHTCEPVLHRWGRGFFEESQWVVQLYFYCKSSSRRAIDMS